MRLDLQPDRFDRSQKHAFGGHSRDPDARSISSSIWRNCTDFSKTGRNPESTCSRKSPIISRATFSARPFAIGTFRARHHISALRSPTVPDNYWYVWFDAPIGYLASTKEWCDAKGEAFDSWWKSAETEIHHFIGKDITYFHTLFWPAMLKTAGFSLPTKVHIHGFLTVGGEKMSKSKGTFVKAETYLKHLDPAYLRYYFASKLGSGLDDLDLNTEEFVTKVNSDLVGKVVNLASRTAKFLQNESLSAAYPDDGGLFAKAAEAGDQIAAAYEACDYNLAMRLVMGCADRANKFVDDRQPWNLRKDPVARGRAARRVYDFAQFVPPVGDLPGAGVARAWLVKRRSCSTPRSGQVTGKRRPGRNSARRSAPSST